MRGEDLARAVLAAADVLRGSDLDGFTAHWAAHNGRSDMLTWIEEVLEFGDWRDAVGQ